MKILVLCLLVSLAFAQENDTIQAELDAIRVAELLAIQANYDTQQATQARFEHLFCLNRTTAMTEDGTGVTVSISEFEQNGAYVWTLFFQVPVISYLDPQRKLSLMDTVMQVLDRDNYDTRDICIGTYETYRLSYFEESVIVHVYGRNGPINAETWSNRFNDMVESALDDGGNGYVIRYPGQSGVVALNFSGSAYFNNLLQPLQQNDEGVDLTSLAVLIGSFGYNYTFADNTEDSVSRDISSQRWRSFADNTNPINYGLEPGDYVFAVFASILSAIVCGLIILGYFIHPFFLA